MTPTHQAVPPLRWVRLRRLAIAAMIAVLAALLFAWAGLYNVGATAGHWPGVAWALRYAMQNSVATHALTVEPPPLADPAMIERGAGHYDLGCAPCHGAPGRPAIPIPQNTLPPPPYLPSVVRDWTPAELFWIVKHGLKYTGMPAWAAPGRDDEVWAVIAFLLTTPDMTPEAYATLVKGGAASAIAATAGGLFGLDDGALLAACARCHGADGAARPSGAFPRLDGQTPDYLLRALTEYASGTRPSGTMQPLAAMLDDEQAIRAATYFAARAVAPTGAETWPETLELGRRLAVEGVPGRRVPACATCHGLEEGPVNPLFPSLNGQHVAYTVSQLQLWKSGRRGGSAYSRIMAPVAERLDAVEMRAVAAFYSTLPNMK